VYHADLAHIHHAGYGDVARGAGPEIVRILQQHAIEQGVVVELGCGSGILAGYLGRAGYGVVGVDVSLPMLEIARSAAPAALMVQSSIHAMEFPACVAIVAIGEGVQYIPENREGVDAEALFRRVARALSPGGVFVFDVMVSGGGEPLAYRRSSYGPGWAVHVQVTEDRSSGVVTRVIDTQRRVGCRYRTGRETHRVQLFDEREVVAGLGAVGFDVTVSGGYGEWRLAERRRAFVATRKVAG
jgi:SAM-dependent methyltransferase